MTITLEKIEINNTAVCIEQDKFSDAYRVTAYHVIGVYGYPVTSLTYGTRKKADVRFQYLVRKARRGEI